MSDKRRKILVASTNPGKLAELRAMLAGDVEWVGLSAFEGLAPIEEDGLTFAENARKKALSYAKATGLWTVADDSGLVIDALGGAPGVKSARFSQSTETDRKVLDRKNTAKVLELLKGVCSQRRTARFVCRLCLASSERVLIEAEGVLEGLIAEREAGENGFGYDPIFFVAERDKTVAQLTREEKNAISHRSKAIRKLKPLLDALVHDEQMRR